MSEIPDSEVLKRFVGPDGRLLAIPTKHAKRMVVLDHLAQSFEPGVVYAEAEVNEILKAVHDDHAALRRYLVDQGFLERSEGHYWRAGGTVVV
jgi:hypothetical protein